MTLQSETSVSHGKESSQKPGLADPVFDTQATFRAALLGTAYPGRIIPLDREISAPKPFSAATASLCQTLMDFETPAWLDDATIKSEAAGWLRFHCGLPTIDDTAKAKFAVITEPQSMPRMFQFHPGEPEYPDRSTTLIIQVPSCTSGPKTIWTGPGIKAEIEVRIDGLPFWFWHDWDLNRELYPRGIDVIFSCGNALIGMPRTVLVSDRKED